MNEREIFGRAIEIDNESGRLALLKELCGDDTKMIMNVEQLLKEHFRKSEFVLDEPVIDATAEMAELAEKVGTTIGPYKLREQIGEGGMGVVYVAEQSEPVRRRVALKIIKPGMNTKDVMARFAAERQALAMMDHPHIARVLDAGATESARPYFVMELVRGIPITKFCDKNKLGAGERLALFIDVCHAIQHAHQKGIIHRDIKPSNVLVTSHDGKPIVKVIDFGVAKAINQRLTEQTIYTKFAQMVGTPLYMSPEQAEMSALDVDTRADIYSLGVLLYELLTGSPPFANERFRKAAFDEMRRIIREEEPSKPSEKINTLGEADSNVCLDRGTDPRKLSQLIRGDLDWIVMKALEKDRDRRYETANGFANDVQRYLDHDAVVAAPPSIGYRIKKFVLKNQGPVVAASLVLLAMLGGIIGTTIGFVEAKRQEKIALRAATEKEKARQAASDRAEGEKRANHEMQIALRLAEERTKEAGDAREKERLAKTQAEEHANELVVITKFQQAMLSEVSSEAMGRSIVTDARRQIKQTLITSGKSDTDVDAKLAAFDDMISHLNATDVALKIIDEHILTRASEMIIRDLSDQPVIRAAIEDSIAATYRAIGLYQQSFPLQTSALETRRKALGDEHPDTLTSINNMGTLLQLMGRNKTAETHWHEALETRRRVLGVEHPDTLTSISNMGFLFQSIGEFYKAEPYFREALDGWSRLRGEDHPSTLEALVHVGELQQLIGNYDAAVSHYRDALKRTRRVRGDRHPDTLISISVLGLVLNEMGKPDEAEPYLREALEGQRQVLGEDHPRTLKSISNFAWVLMSKRQYDEAESYYRRALDGRRRVLGKDHPSTLRSINNMGSLYKSMEQYEQADAFYREALENRRRTLGNENWETIRTINDLGELFHKMGKLDEAWSFFNEALVLRRKVLGIDHPSTLKSIHMMGRLLRDLGRFDEAEAHSAEAVHNGRRVLLNNGRFFLGILLDSHGNNLTKLERFKEAEQSLLEAHQILKPGLGAGHRQTVNVIKSLVELYNTWHSSESEKGHDDKAARWQEELSTVPKTNPM